MSQMVKLPGHHHPVVIARPDFPGKCDECRHAFYEMHYSCEICWDIWHKKCMPTSSEINHPCHPNHALKLLTDGPPDYSDGKCQICRAVLNNFVYHCSTCNFSLDVPCAKSPGCISIDESKCHNHPLNLMARQVSFVCNVCGTCGERNPYVCLACSFMAHKDCVNLPHIIIINRHDHRISHTYSLGPGTKICGICRQNIDWIYGAYSCMKCPAILFHSKCATNPQVCDGEELEGVPEEEEDEPMFKVIGENVINHVKHPSHNLTLSEDGVVCDASIRCQLCYGLVYSDKFFSCMECDYILHETCAFLPSRMRHCLYSFPISLVDSNRYFNCKACKRYSTGHRYTYHRSRERIEELDLRCASVNWSCDHDCHPHTLFLTTTDHDTCGVCKSRSYVLRCVECKFNLCYKCASYPKKVMHRCDDHHLVLSFGDKKQHGTHWCTVCEAKINLKKWFYVCEECGIVGHIDCVIGEFSNMKPILCSTAKDYGVVRNSGVTRPHCRSCSRRCLLPFIYRIYAYYFCSFGCVIPYAKRYFDQSIYLCF
ncbi:DC1 [Arabidopsis suecica]|uniref:DC1 n=1 Tax=Arabidopsis suecica TaxID=45249 RepID=A0A8T2CHF8_ARASU|nr:DC1 [Arabidopsis suecica]